MQNNPAAVATTKTRTKKIQSDLRAAAAELHESNKVLVQAAAGSTDVSVKEAVTQILEVEKRLHAAVDELARMTALLKAAEDEGKAARQGAHERPSQKVPAK